MVPDGSSLLRCRVLHLLLSQIAPFPVANCTFYCRGLHLFPSRIAPFLPFVKGAILQVYLELVLVSAAGVYDDRQPSRRASIHRRNTARCGPTGAILPPASRSAAIAPELAGLGAIADRLHRQRRGLSGHAEPLLHVRRKLYLRHLNSFHHRSCHNCLISDRGSLRRAIVLAPERHLGRDKPLALTPYTTHTRTSRGCRSPRCRPIRPSQGGLETTCQPSDQFCFPARWFEPSRVDLA